MSEPKERKTLEERNQASDLERLRHSCAHVLAAAICRIWPQAQLAAGPAIENGFYYDIELDHNITTAEFELIEAEMKKALQRRVEIICGIASLKLGEEVFRDINIEFSRNIPADEAWNG